MVNVPKVDGNERNGPNNYPGDASEAKSDECVALTMADNRALLVEILAEVKLVRSNISQKVTGLAEILSST